MIPVNVPAFLGNEKRYLAECIDTGWISSEGPFVRRFEEGMARLCDRAHAVAVCNGSVALDLALLGLDLVPGDEVILPSFTIISCAAAIIRAGAVPVPVDVDPITWNMGADAVEMAITPRTRALMLVHIYGLCSDLDSLLAVAEHHKLQVIEDAAEAHGQRYHQRPCGSFGKASTFSFYTNKHIATGEGGMVLTDDARVAADLRSRRNLCFGSVDRFVHEELGWNYRMSNLQAAVGVAQLEQLPQTIVRKQAIGRFYLEQLADLPMALPLPGTRWCENHYWVFGVVLDPAAGRTAKDVMSRLAALGIGCRPFFHPLHRQPVLRHLWPGQPPKCPVADRLGDYGFYLPSGAGLTDDQAAEVVARVREVVA